MKKDPEGYWALFKIIDERTKSYLAAQIRPGLLNPLFGLPEPDDSPRAPIPSANERYWLTWFREFSEIHASLERLDQALVYLSHYPGSRISRFHRLSEAEWMRYHIEAYLQEVYILSERLQRFLRKVEKATISARDKLGINLVKELKLATESSFKNVVGTRGQHVHESRFEDDELRSLDLALLFTRGKSKLPGLRTARKLRYVAALKKWRKQ